MFKLASLIFSIVGTTVAGIIMTAMLSMPHLVDAKPLYLVAGGAVGFLLAIPISLLIAKAILDEGIVKK